MMDKDENKPDSTDPGIMITDDGEFKDLSDKDGKKEEERKTEIEEEKEEAKLDKDQIEKAVEQMAPGEIGDSELSKGKFKSPAKLIAQVLFIGAAVVSVPAAIYLLFIIMRSGSGVSATEFSEAMQMTIFKVLPLTSLIAGFSGTIIFFMYPHTSKKLPILLLSLPLLLLGVWLGIQQNEASKNSEEYNRILSINEMVERIEACEVRGFTQQEDGNVRVFYINNWDGSRNWIWRAQTANGSNYSAYVRATERAVANGCIELDYF